MTNTERQDVYTRITEQIIRSLEQGVRPWIQPWNNEHAAGPITRPLRYTGQPYSGINILMLWASAATQGFTAPIWMTFRQAVELNAHVRKGERGSLVVYANSVTKTESDPDGNEVERAIRFLKAYTVFNVEQIDGLPEIYYTRPEPRFSVAERITHAEIFFANTGARIRYAGNRAYYAMDGDYIQMPPFEAFSDAVSFYDTLGHECAHWTKHPSRLNRDLGVRSWGDEGYSREELVAELSSAFLAADLELTPQIRDDHAAYIGSWIKVLKNDPHAIFFAAAQAQQAVDFLHRLQHPKVEAAA